MLGECRKFRVPDQCCQVQSIQVLHQMRPLYPVGRAKSKQENVKCSLQHKEAKQILNKKGQKP